MTQGSLFSRNNPQTTLAVYVALPLRLIVGYGFVEHGMAKWFKGPDTFVAILHALRVPAPHLMAWLTIGTEILGGIAILLGAFVSPGGYSHDHLGLRRHRHSSSSIRLQLDQAYERYSRAGPVRTSGIRMRSALHRLHPGARPEWPESVVDRRLSFAQRARRFGLSVFHDWPAGQTSDEPNTIGSI
jgi:DoxX